MLMQRICRFDFLIALCCWLSCPTPGHAFFSLTSIQPALARIADYGYSMLGYNTNSYAEDDLEIYEKEPIWDGHINVGDIVKPIVSALGGKDGVFQDMYGNQQRVVHGYDNRLGVRLALPHIGDFQVTREIGPGIFLDKLGPGKYPYSHLPSKGKGKGHHGEYGYESPPNKGYYKKPYKGLGYDTKGYAPKGTYNKVVYQSLQNYPWYNR